MRLKAPVLVILAAIASALLLAQTVRATSNPVPVVVELFTSEGCSSCPPADQLLARLAQEKVDGQAELILLGEHVDYWDGPGWRDRFSSREYSARQSDYASRFQLGSVYTPQMVIDGRREVVGNDAAEVRSAIAAALQSPKPAAVRLAWDGGESLNIRVENAGNSPARVLMAVTENDLSTRVHGGENGGRVLHHAAVVRSMKSIGSTSEGHYTATVNVPLRSDWARNKLKVIVFVENQGVLGAAEVDAR